MADMKATVIERDLNPYHSFLASFFAGLAELGLVNQGSINIVSKRAAEYLYSYLDAKEILPDMKTVPGGTTAEVVKNLILYINKVLSLMGGFDFKEADDGHVVLLVAGDECRICPEGVGGAAVKGTFCPIPSFLESLVNRFADKEIIKLKTNGIEKDGTTCKAFYEVLV